MKDLEPEFEKIINENFWDLISNQEEEKQMTKYKHIPTDSIVEEYKFNGRRWYVSPKTGESIPTSIVESGGKDWEKIEPENEKGYTITKVNTCLRILSPDSIQTSEILSVLRKSDNKEFRVGQEYLWKDKAAKLTSFRVLNDILIVSIIYDDTITLSTRLSEIQPLPERKPLFKTEDGKEYYDELSEVCGVCIENGENKFDIASGSIKWFWQSVDDWKYFSTLAAAEEFVVNNKPVFSLSNYREMASWTRGEIKKETRKRCGLDKEEEKV